MLLLAAIHRVKKQMTVDNVFSQVLCCNWTDCCEDLKRCVAMTCFGKFLHTVIAGWDDSECARTYDAICQHTSVLKNVKLILGAKAGKLVYKKYCKSQNRF